LLFAGVAVVAVAAVAALCVAAGAAQVAAAAAHAGDGAVGAKLSVARLPFCSMAARFEGSTCDVVREMVTTLNGLRAVDAREIEHGNF